MKRTQIEKIIKECIVTNMSEAFTAKGYKFRKKDSVFKNSNKEYEHYISINCSRSWGELYYDEIDGKLYFSFRIDNIIRLLDYEIWYKKNLEEEIQFKHNLGTTYCYFERALDDFSKSDFSSNTNHNVHVKPNMLDVFKNFYNRKYISFDNYIADILPLHLTVLDHPPSIELIFKSRTAELHPHYVDLMIYSNDSNRANELYDETFNLRCKQLQEAIENGSNRTEKIREEFGAFIIKANRILAKDYKLPSTIDI